MRKRELLFITLSIFLFIRSYAQSNDDFPGVHPGKPVAILGNSALSLSNKSLQCEWELSHHCLYLKSITNKYDKQKVVWNHSLLFAVQLADGTQLTNADFVLTGSLKQNDIRVSDSLPTKALRFDGKEISGNFINEPYGISLKWTAQLREGSNYIRQSIEISALSKPVPVNKIIFFDQSLPGAFSAGSVLGSPIEYKNFFFGLEHPIAHSKALAIASVGSLEVKEHDVTKLINSNGNYCFLLDFGGSESVFNVNGMQLLENGKPISVVHQNYIGKGGNNEYVLKVKDYHSNSKYEIELLLPANQKRIWGNIHFYKKTNDILNFWLERTDSLTRENRISESVVIGVAEPKQMRRCFLYYLERERARPYKQFLHYNNWWDITVEDASSFTSEQVIGRMNSWNEKFIKPYNVTLNSFVFDDGWDNLDSVWYFDPVKFPNGFLPQAELCKKMNSGIGVWMSPFGGYGDSKKRRLQSALREGLETNARGLSLAGKNYYNRFLERSLDMLNHYKVNYFKFDGFGGYEPQYLPDMEAGARLIKTLRKSNPDVFINITVGSWPSPFWLMYADCTWRGGNDAYNIGEGTRTQQFITYRDGALYNNIVRRAPFYPLNSIMTSGIAYANLGYAKEFVDDSLIGFKDMVRSFFAAGSALQELYISHDRMKPEFWPVLAEAAKWAKANENILKDVHWIGGSPMNLEAYGFASWSEGKGIIALRNPSSTAQNFSLDLKTTLELPQNFSASSFVMKSPWKENEAEQPVKLKNTAKTMIHLKPFETKVMMVDAD